MKLCVPKEIIEGENRVALVPDAVAKLVKSGIHVFVESKAGDMSFLDDGMYESAGATIVPDVVSLLKDADVVLKVQRPVENKNVSKHEVELMPSGSSLITFIQHLQYPDLIKILVDRHITSFSMDAIPRIARAQSMDALSSMSSIAGYKAVIMAAETLGKYFPMMVTAAGTTPPAKGLILGAGVAGLQAIATGRRLGAVVEAFDVRPAVKEQVESLGAKFLAVDIEEKDVEDTGGYAKELSKESQKLEEELVHSHVQSNDFVVTTALIPGKIAPTLISENMVKDMKPGSVIVDIASEAGGNCELTEPGKTVVKHGVVIHGQTNLPSTMPYHASQLYSKNISALFSHLQKDGKINLDMEDSITTSCCITHDGKIVNELAKGLVK